MSYKVELAHQAEKEFAKLDRDHQQRIAHAFLNLQEDPFLGKRLRGQFKGLWSYRLWPYRIVYQIYQKQLLVFIVRIAHRQGVYKK